MAYRPPPIGRKKLILSDAARRDIDQQVIRRAETMGFDSASGLAIYLDAELARMAWIGHSGVAREEISPGLRLHVVGVYSVYFRTTVDETRIVRLLRGSMDITGMDFSPNQDG